LPIFKIAKNSKPLDMKSAIADVAARYGKSGWRQAVEVAALSLGPRRIDPTYYYQAALFRPDLTPDQKQAHVSNVTGARLNERLSPRKTGLHRLFANKLLTGLTLQAAGFPALRPLAFYTTRGGAPGLTALDSAAAIAGFLASDGALPCFGKPVDGSLAIGGASFIALTPDGAGVQLGDGSIATLQEVGAQIVQYFPQGYLFQPLIRQRSDFEALVGPAVGSLRVVTLWGSGAPEGLYTIVKMPAKGAMMDGGTPGRMNLTAQIDPKTGTLLRAQASSRMNDQPADTSPATGLPLAGVTIPEVPEAVALCCEAHRLFPSHGLLAFDIAFGHDGLIINEINVNPFHYVYQRSADRGLLNPDFAPRIQAVIDYMANAKGRG